MNTPSFHQEMCQQEVVVTQNVTSVSLGGMSCVAAEVKEAWSSGCPQSDCPATGWDGPAGRWQACHHPVCPCFSPLGPRVGDVCLPACPPPTRLTAPGISWPGRRTQAVVERQTRLLFVQGLGRQFGGNLQTAHSATSQHFSKTAWPWLGLAARGGWGLGARNRAGGSRALGPAG